MMPGLNVLRQGRSGAPALLLIHPLGADRRFWEPVAQRLEGDADLVGCDLRSAGRSEVAGRPLSVADHVADLQDLIEDQKLDRFWIAGCAVGAVIGAALAASVGDRLCGAVLSNPTASFSKPAQDVLEERSRIILKHGMAAIADQVIDRAFHGLPPQAGLAFRGQFMEQSPQGYADLARGICTADVTEDLRRIEAPVLVLASPNDLLLPPERAEEVAALLPNATLRRVEAGAHFIPYQAPGPFSDLTREFMQLHSAGRG